MTDMLYIFKLFCFTYEPMRNSVTSAGRTYFWYCVIKVKTYDVNMTDREYVLTL